MAEIEHSGYRYRLAPTLEQTASFARWAGCARAIWNAALEQRQTAWRLNRASVRYEQQGGAELTAAKRAHRWLAEPHSDVCQQALRDLDRAFQRFFRGDAGYPRFKRRGRDAFRVQSRRAKGEIKVRRLSGRWGEVRVPKLGWVRFRWSRTPVGKIKHLTISRDALGWHVSLCCERQVAIPAAHPGPPVGIDRGVRTTVALSTGELRTCQGLPPGQTERLRRLERRAGRQETTRRARGLMDRRRSARHQRTLDAIARLRAREARIRQDFLHRLSHGLAKSHSVIAIERLDIVAMTQSAGGTLAVPGQNVAQKRGLNRAVLAQGWGALRRQLAYKLHQRGGVLVEVPAAHSSQECARCGAVDPRSRRRQHFACVVCGHCDHADVNAARVILARALDAQEDGRRTDACSAGSLAVGQGAEPRTTPGEAAGAAAGDLAGIPRL